MATFEWVIVIYILKIKLKGHEIEKHLIPGGQKASLFQQVPGKYSGDQRW